MYAQNHNPLNFPSMHKPMCVEEMAGYDLTYTYQDSVGHKFQLANVRDVNYRTEGTADENDKVNNGHRYTYDANGNLVYIDTSRIKKDGKEDEKATEQKYRWDEENRLLAADENGFVSNYWYDADGERTVKTSGEGEQIYVNSEFAGGRTNTAKFSLYVSPYLVANQGGRYTKHIYIGSQRIVSKLGDLASYGADPRRIPYAGNEADGLTVDYKTKYSRQQQSIKDNYKAFDQPYNGKDNDDYVNGQGFCCNDGTPEAAQARAMARTRAASGNFKPNDDYEKMQFYYHPDHLGSSSYITNLDGEVSQHIEYVPFGEVFVEERNNIWNTPYLFNAKEFDEETGLYYYGARYYEPRLSLWISTDPMQEKYPNVSGYVYCLNNPILFKDPDGKDVYMFIETKGTGHTFIVVKDKKGTTVYTYGRYQGGNWYTGGSTGSGVLVKYNGKNARRYITAELYRMKAEAFQIKDASDAKVRKYFDNQYNSSNQNPTTNDASINANGKVVDTYVLFGNNCTTKSCDAIKYGGSKVFDVEGLIFDYDEDFTIPSSLKNFLKNNSSENGNIVNKTMEFKSNYPNASNKQTLKSAGSAGSSSGCLGSSAGSSANSSSTRSSSSGNGSGSFGSGSNSSSSQDFNR